MKARWMSSLMIILMLVCISNKNAIAQQQITINYEAEGSDVLPEGAKVAISEALKVWPYSNDNGIFYMVGLRWETTWALSTIVTLDETLQNDDGVIIKDELTLLLVQINNTWQAALEGNAYVFELLQAIPESELSLEARNALFLKALSKASQSQETLKSYKFPWASDIGFVITRYPYGWHAPDGLDFAPRPKGINTNILVSATGIITDICRNTNGVQTWIKIKTKDSNEVMEYWHIHKNTIPKEIKEGIEIAQGAILGQMVEGNVIEHGYACSMHSDGTHLHLAFPEKPFILDGYTFTSDPNGNLKVIDREGKEIANPFSNNPYYYYSTQSQIEPAPYSQYRSLRSYNYPKYFIAHRNWLGEMITVSTELDRKDTTFNIVPGLADPTLISFESANYPGHYLRHEDFRIGLHPYQNTDLFKKDSTFRIVKGLANSQWVSFESVNFPGYYIRHSSSHLYIARGSDDLFRRDVTFKIDSPNWEHSKSLRSYNHPEYFMAHRNWYGEIIKVSTAFDRWVGDAIQFVNALDRKDSTFTLVPGLADPTLVSFKSVNYPGYYLRHDNFRLSLSQYRNEELFKKDSTFKIVNGLADPNWVSFESLNFPGYYIRHSSYHLYIASGNDDLFRKDATFKIESPNWTDRAMIPLSKTGTIMQNAVIGQPMALYRADFPLKIAVTWPGSNLDLLITTPSGRKLTSTSTEVLDYFAGEAEEYYVIESEEEGEWLFEILGIEVAPDGEPYEFRLETVENPMITPTPEEQETPTFPTPEPTAHSAVPEPTTWLLVGGGILGILLLFRKKHRK